MDLAGAPASGDDSHGWLVAPTQSFLWREWDGELAIYLDEQGSTHLLTPYAGAVFLTLLQGPSSIGLEELLARLAPDEAPFGHEKLPEAGSRQDVLQVMAEFERIGLVRRH